jgi:hypothetical protein
MSDNPSDDTSIPLDGRGIIHKDIKPANVMVDPTAGQCGFRLESALLSGEGPGWRFR